MALSSNLERLGYGSPDGCVATGLHRQVIQSVGATRTLLPEESGALCLFDAATGVTFTLPAAAEGMQFDFAFSVSRTSTNAYKVITASGDFLLGAYMAGDPAIATSGDIFTGDGSTHVAITLDADANNAPYVGTISMPQTTAGSSVTHRKSFSMAPVFGGSLPKKYVLVFQNQTGASLPASGHSFEYAEVYYN